MNGVLVIPEQTALDAKALKVVHQPLHSIIDHCITKIYQ
jgi:hypothetical protein